MLGGWISTYVWASGGLVGKFSEWGLDERILEVC